MSLACVARTCMPRLEESVRRTNSLHTSQNSIAMWKFVSVDHFRRSLRGRMPSLAKRCVAGGEQRVVRLALGGGRDRQIGGDARIRWPAVHAECFDYVGAEPCS